MKRKIRIKKLPKAQKGIMVPDYMGTTSSTPSLTSGMTPFVMNATQPFNSSDVFGTTAFPTLPKTAPSVTPLLNDEDQFNEAYGPLTSANYYANVAEQNTAAPAGTTFTEDAAFEPGFAPQVSQQSQLPDLSGLSNIPQGAGFVPFIQSGIFANLGNRVDEARRSADFKNRFLSDNMYASIPEGYSGNRGDYTLNQQIGLGFRPDEAVYGQFGKIAKYGGSMKRKIKITGLPQAAYGGTQNKASVDEMYPYNSNVRRAAYSDMLEGESQGEVRQYAEEVPREIANIEAEKGETIVKPNDQGLVNMYKIGGKRHSEGGTPLQADPNDFIFSDTKDMKIKDPAILESFGMQVQKKGRKGYTPAEISKKFNLNDPAMQRALNDPKADRIEKATAERMYDNNLSQLGKLALVQEGRKGFPQGAPDISMPYMQKVGMDPSMFMPDVMTPQDATFEMGKAQMGQQVPGVLTNPIQLSSQTNQPRGLGYTIPIPEQQSQQQVAQSTPTPTPVSTPAPQRSTIDPSSIYGDESFITKYGKGTGNKVRVMLDPDASYEDKVKLAHEATVLDFGTGTKAPVQQGKTEGYKYFYAGLTPSDFEKRYLQGFMDVKDIDALTPLERRKKLFDELGIEATEEELSNPKSLYNNQDWLKNTFYSAFKKKLPEDQFRSVMGDDFKFGLEHFDNIPKRETPPPPATPTPDPGPTPGKITKQPQPADPGKYYIQDLMNTGLAAGDRLGLKKYLPYDATLPQPVLMDPTFYDPSRELAATSEMANIVTRNIGQFTGPQSFNARASEIQGNAAKAVANTLGRYNNLNVGVANQFEQANKSLINDFNIKNAMAKNNYYDKTVIANQQYDNAKRAANARLMRQATNAITNKAMTQVLNSMYPEYSIDPTVGGEMMYMPSQRTFDGSSVQPGNNIASTRKMFENDPEFNALSPKEKFDVLAKFMPRQSSTTRRYDPRDAFFYNMMRGRRRQG